MPAPLVITDYYSLLLLGIRTVGSRTVGSQWSGFGYDSVAIAGHRLTNECPFPDCCSGCSQAPINRRYCPASGTAGQHGIFYTGEVILWTLCVFSNGLIANILSVFCTLFSLLEYFCSNNCTASFKGGCESG